MFSGRSGSVSAPWNSVANYSTDDKRFRVTHQQNVGFRTWEEVAAIYRSLWQLEFDGFSHEPPTVDTLETEQAEANTEIPPAPEPTGTGTPENVEELRSKLEKLIICIEVGAWDRAETFSHNIKELLEEGPQELKKAAFRLEMNVRKEKYDKAVEQYNNLKELFEENIGGM